MNKQDLLNIIADRIEKEILPFSPIENVVQDLILDFREGINGNDDEALKMAEFWIDSTYGFNQSFIDKEYEDYQVRIYTDPTKPNAIVYKDKIIPLLEHLSISKFKKHVAVICMEEINKNKK